MKRITGKLASCGVAAAMLLFPLVAMAAEAEGGMPQLRFGDQRLIGTTVWLVVMFGALYYIVSSYLLPPVGEVLADRAARIGADLTLARDTKSEADAAIRETRTATAEARAAAQAEVAASLAAANAEAQARAEAASARLAERIAAAEAGITASQTAAMAALRDVATETAVALVARIGVQADAGTIGTAVDHALAQRAA
ncbi:ATP synthase F0 subcomplex B subunit [Humitalea rosea]|uniref:ATP synthase subunit b n=1 Tax=Humitalea rosea TaxID=990373 RepID=A0A2W7JDQ9_9PROT|nr:F0F1 ATP synthase subunit B' [Humitalea rosea]PZW50322.1 ATP synthase F0 subcomplex B subunit [Humitalea rosea]